MKNLKSLKNRLNKIEENVQVGGAQLLIIQINDPNEEDGVVVSSFPPNSKMNQFSAAEITVKLAKWDGETELGEAMGELPENMVILIDDVSETD